MSDIPKKDNFGCVIDGSGFNRLSLLYESNVFQGKECGYNFHSLVWEVKKDNHWVVRKIIKEEDFDSDPVHRKWVSELHSFDPVTAQAIIKVAEGDAPRNENQHFVYSWRKWDLAINKQIELLNVCNDPFENYNGHSS